MFPRDQYGLVRCILWIAIWLLGIVFSKMEELEAVSSSYLIFTVSIMMEFFPSFMRYPNHVHENNRALIMKKKGITVVFFVVVTVIFIASIVISKLPSCAVNLAVLKVWYVIGYAIIFGYLFVNCIMGMMYTPPLDTTQEAFFAKKQDLMAYASEHGNLGDAGPVTTVVEKGE